MILNKLSVNVFFDYYLFDMRCANMSNNWLIHFTLS